MNCEKEYDNFSNLLKKLQDTWSNSQEPMSFTPIKENNDLLFKEIDLDSFVLFFKNIEGIKIDNYFKLQTKITRDYKFDQKKSLPFLFNTESKDYNYFNLQMGFIGNKYNCSVTTVFEIPNSKFTDITLLNRKYYNLLKSIVKEINDEVMNNSSFENLEKTSKLNYTKVKVTSALTLDDENILIHSEIWTDFCKIYNNKINAFKEEFEINNISYFIYNHGIRTNISNRQEFLNNFIANSSHVQLIQFHIALDVIDSNFEKCYTDENYSTIDNGIQGSNLLFKFHNLFPKIKLKISNKVDDDNDDINEKEQLKSIEKNQTFKNKGVQKYYGVTNFKDYGNFTFNVDSNFKKHYTSSNYNYMENNSKDFKFHDSITYIQSYNTYHKLMPQCNKETIAFQYLTSNYGYINKNCESNINFNDHEQIVDRHDKRINAELNKRELKEVTLGFKEDYSDTVKNKILKLNRHDRQTYKDAFKHNYKLKSDDNFNLKNNLNVHEILKIIAANGNSFLNHLKFVKMLLFHYKPLELNKFQDIEFNSTNLLNANSGIDENNFHNITCEKNLSTFAINRLEFVHTFQNIEKCQEWINNDKNYEKQKISVIKFLLSTDLINDDNENEKTNDSSCSKTRLFKIGDKKINNQHSQWTHFVINNYIKIIDSLLNVELKIEDNLKNLTLPNEIDVKEIYFNQEKLQFLFHGNEKCNNILLSQLKTSEALKPFESINSNVILWNKEIKIDEISFNFENFYKTNGTYLYKDRYDYNLTNNCIKIIWELQNNYNERNNTKEKLNDNKVNSFLQLLFKSHILHALKTYLIINDTFKFCKLNVEELGSKSFLEKQINKEMTQFLKKNDVITHGFITADTLIEILDNPLTKQSQLFKSTFGVLIGLHGVSQKFSKELKEILKEFIIKNIQYWPNYYFLENITTKNYSFFQVIEPMNINQTFSSSCELSTLPLLASSSSSSSSSLIKKNSTTSHVIENKSFFSKIKVDDNENKIFLNDFEKFTFIDFETTDLKYKEIVELCLYTVTKRNFINLRQYLKTNLKINNYEKIKINDITEMLDINKIKLVFKSDVQITAKASKINGISNTSLNSYNKFSKETCSLLNNYLNNDQSSTLIIGFNSNEFDLPILKRNFNEYNINLNSNLFSLDVLKIVEKNKSNLKLVNEEILNLSKVNLKFISKQLFDSSPTSSSNFIKKTFIHDAEMDCLQTYCVLASLNDDILNQLNKNIINVDKINSLPSIEELKVIKNMQKIEDDDDSDDEPTIDFLKLLKIKHIERKEYLDFSKFETITFLNINNKNNINKKINFQMSNSQLETSSQSTCSTQSSSSLSVENSFSTNYELFLEEEIKNLTSLTISKLKMNNFLNSLEESNLKQSTIDYYKLNENYISPTLFTQSKIFNNLNFKEKMYSSKIPRLYEEIILSFVQNENVLNNFENNLIKLNEKSLNLLKEFVLNNNTEGNNLIVVTKESFEFFESNDLFNILNLEFKSIINLTNVLNEIIDSNLTTMNTHTTEMIKFIKKFSDNEIISSKNLIEIFTFLSINFQSQVF